MRDYDAGIGRYVESDPIGLGGGINTYGYVGGNPLWAVDPLGLVEWTGAHFTAAIGPITYEIYHLHTGCVNGRRATVEVKAWGVTYGQGGTLGGSHFDTFEDNLNGVDPMFFEGDYMKIAAGWSGGIGYGGAFTVLGGAHSKGIFGVEGGLDASAGIAVGHARVTQSSIENCDCSHK